MKSDDNDDTQGLHPPHVLFMEQLQQPHEPGPCEVTPPWTSPLAPGLNFLPASHFCWESCPPTFPGTQPPGPWPTATLPRHPLPLRPVVLTSLTRGYCSEPPDVTCFNLLIWKLKSTWGTARHHSLSGDPYSTSHQGGHQGVGAKEGSQGASKATGGLEAGHLPQEQPQLLARGLWALSHPYAHLSANPHPTMASWASCLTHHALPHRTQCLEPRRCLIIDGGQGVGAHTLTWDQTVAR